MKNKAEKMDNYAKLVKEMHKPVISKKKRKELELLRKSVEIGARPLRRPMSKNTLALTDGEKPKGLEKHRQTRSQAKIDWNKFVNPMVPKEKPKKEGFIVDYLSKKRNQRMEKEQDLNDMGLDYRNPYYDWKGEHSLFIN